MKYKVWNPDDEGPEDAEEIESTSPEGAAEIFTMCLWNIGQVSDAIDVMVQDENGDEYDVTVELDYQPSFFAYGRKVRK